VIFGASMPNNRTKRGADRLSGGEEPQRAVDDKGLDSSPAEYGGGGAVQHEGGMSEGKTGA
jgi:hypothetical protein